MLTFHDALIRLLFAAAMGAIIGAERDYHRRPAGIRTSMFVCLATALFTILSQQLGHLWGDTGSTRIASNIVQGIGFLGAGAILKDNLGQVGMTTAATVFVEAAIGMAAGGGFLDLAGASTGIVLFALGVVGWITPKLNLKSKTVLYRFTTSHRENLASELHGLLREMRVPILKFRSSMTGGNSTVEFEVETTHKQESDILKQMNRPGVVAEVIPFDEPYA